MVLTESLPECCYPTTFTTLTKSPLTHQHIKNPLHQREAIITMTQDFLVLITNMLYLPDFQANLGMRQSITLV